MKRILGTTRRYLMACSALAIFCVVLGCGSTKPGMSPPPPVGNVSTGVASNLMLGYVWDSTVNGLRPIYGLPGAAYMGSPIYNDGTYKGAIACVRQGYALLNAKNGQISLAKLPSGTPVRLAARLSPKQLIVMSPSCGTALVYGTDIASALVISGLPDAPLVRSIGLSGSDSVTDAAIADSGTALFATRQSDGSVQLHAIAAGTGIDTTLISLSALGGIAFLPRVDTALVVDAGKNTVSLMSVNGNAGATQVASAADGIQNPKAVAVSADGRWGLVADSKKPGIIRLDLSRQLLPLSIPCPCTPSHLDRLAGNSVFQLTDLNSGPLWTFDGDAVVPRSAFIPAVPSPTNSGVNR